MQLTSQSVSSLLACVLLLDHLDDLYFGEFRLHIFVLKLGGLYRKLEKGYVLASLVESGAKRL